jgi:hypothetical protein
MRKQSNLIRFGATWRDPELGRNCHTIVARRTRSASVIPPKKPMGQGFVRLRRAAIGKMLPIN